MAGRRPTSTGEDGEKVLSSQVSGLVVVRANEHLSVRLAT